MKCSVCYQAWLWPPQTALEGVTYLGSPGETPWVLAEEGGNLEHPALLRQCLLCAYSTELNVVYMFL